MSNETFRYYSAQEAWQMHRDGYEMANASCVGRPQEFAIVKCPPTQAQIQQRCAHEISVYAEFEKANCVHCGLDLSTLIEGEQS